MSAPYRRAPAIEERGRCADAQEAALVEGHRYQLPYEPGLDGLRAFAIIGVVLYHATRSAGLPNYLRGGPITLTIFFTLSGFLIMSILLRDVGSGPGSSEAIQAVPRDPPVLDPRLSQSTS